MKTIYKYNIEPDIIVQPISMPAGARILSAGADGNGYPAIWAEVDSKAHSRVRYFWCVGTGWNLDSLFLDEEMKYIGTAILPIGEVYHIYEQTEFDSSST